KVNKADAIVVLGTTGEAPVITRYEREKIIDFVSSGIAGSMPVIIGTGTNNTSEVIEMNKIAERYNAAGVLIVNPYYNKGTQKSLVDHYKNISEHTSLPILLYNVPSRTGMNLLPETVYQIHSSCKNVAGIKEASGDISQIVKLFSIMPDDFLIFSGNDDQVLPIMALGGNGVISVFSNLLPDVMGEICKAMLDKNFEKAVDLNKKYLRLMNILFAETNPIPIKYALSCLGLCSNILRLPLSPASEKTMQLIDDELEVLGVSYAES